MTYVFNNPVHPSRRLVNEEVAVTGIYFRPGRHLKGFPKRMEYRGREYTFIESGLRYLVRKGQQFIEIFDMTDGTDTYRLKLEADDNRWTLIGIRSAQAGI